MVYHKLNEKIKITLLLVIFYLMNSADNFVKMTFAYLLFLAFLLVMFESYAKTVQDSLYQSIGVYKTD